MNETIRPLRRGQLAFAALFGVASLLLMGYYLSDTLIHFTTNQQFPISSFQRFPLTLLIFPAELFSFCFALYFVYVIFRGQGVEGRPAPLHDRENTGVAILLPVYNEPKEIVRRTIAACKAVRWPGSTRIYLLDDSSEEGDRRNMAELGREHGCVVVRRQGRAGYKAGNVENALRRAVAEPYFVIFDADQAPLPEFLELTMDHFSDPKVAFVQTPQYFVDETTPLERAAKVGTNIFYHAQCVGKSRDGALPFCGTNAVIRTAAYREVGGFSYYTATEDIELGLRMNQAGYRGVYVPVVLAHGYAPPDFKAYASQQYRWANGNLAILRESWRSIIFGNLSLRQQIHTLFTLGWWLVGLATIAYITVPVLSLLLGMGTHHTWLPTTLLVLLYFNIAMGVVMIYASLRGRLKGERVTLWDAVLQYVLITNSAFIFARAAVNALFKRYVGFVRTKKTRSASGWRQVKWNLLLSAVCLSFSLFALYKGATAVTVEQLRTYLPISLWLLFYGLILGASIIFVGERPAREKSSAATTSGTVREREAAA
jgi:cellulose synthase (UDP-forming)